MLKTIVIKFQWEGIHNWPDCDISEVSFLKHPHRHIFHITCYKEISHNNRDIEIIMLKRDMINFLNIQFKDGELESRSCEDLAEMLLTKYNLESCEVLEDGENGAKIWK